MFRFQGVRFGTALLTERMYGMSSLDDFPSAPPDKEYEGEHRVRRIMQIAAPGLVLWLVLTPLLWFPGVFDFLTSLLISTGAAALLVFIVEYRKRTLAGRREVWAREPEEPPHLVPSDLLVEEGLLDHDEVVYYDFEPRWVVGLMMVLRPWHTAKAQNGQQEPPKGEAGSYLISALAQFAVLGTALVGTRLAEGWLQLFALVVAAMQLGWIVTGFFLNKRLRHIATNRQIKLIQAQRPFADRMNTGYPAQQFTQFSQRRTVLGGLLGYAHFVVRSVEHDEILSRLNFVKHPKVMEAALRFIEHRNTHPVTEPTSNDVPQPRQRLGARHRPPRRRPRSRP